MAASPTACLVVFNFFLIIAFIFVALRLWARRIKNTRLQVNDYAILVAFLLGLGLVISLNQCVTDGGAGRHTQNVDLDSLVLLLKETVVVSVFWISVNSAVKVSVVHFYTTLFPNRAFQIITHTTIWLVILYWVATVVATFLICRPFAYNWDQTISGTCGDLHSFWLASSVIGLVFDIWVVVLPMPILWGLHMKLSRKIALVFIFGLGAFICIITILRIVANEKIVFTDLPYTAADVLVWTALEPLLGIVNACLPLMAPVLAKVSVAVTSITGALTGRAPSTGNSSAKPLWIEGGSKKYPFPREFKRIREPYELPSLATAENLVTVEGEDEYSGNKQSNSSPAGPTSAEVITVTRNWNIRTDPGTKV